MTDAAPAPHDDTAQPPSSGEGGRSETSLRVLTALVLAPILLGATFLGGLPFAAVLLVAALVAQHEVYDLMGQGGSTPAVGPGLLLGVVMFAGVAVSGWLPLAAACCILLIVASPFVVAEEGGIADLAGTLFGVLYPTGLLAFLVLLREGLALPEWNAFWLTVTTFFLVWATDIGAYYVGRAFGRHALAPAISPKKTWEGAVGGAVCALAVGVLMRLLVLDVLPWVHLVVVALICGVVSQLGDLAESRMKRAAGAKDSGTILPGHGGVLDRLDATIVAAPLVYLYLAFVAGMGA